MRVIKRYANRKLYDPQESRYVTLEDVATLVREGVDLRIIENKTGEDLTARTLAQILYESELKDQASLPLGPLRQLIQSGGDLITRHVAQPVTTLKVEAERTVTQIRSDFEKKVSKLVLREKDNAEALKAGFREWMESTVETFEQTQARVEERLSKALQLAAVVRAQAEELSALKRRVTKLEDQSEDEAPSDPEPSD